MVAVRTGAMAIPGPHGRLRLGGLMKLARYGRAGREKPALVDGSGKLRDLSDVVADIDADVLSPRSLARLAKLKPESLPAVRGSPRIGPCLRAGRQFRRRRAQLRRSCGRVRHAGAQGAAAVQQGAVLRRRPERRRRDPQGLEEDRLGGRARGRDRHARELRQREPTRSPMSRAIASATTCRSASSSTSDPVSG